MKKNLFLFIFYKNKKIGFNFFNIHLNKNLEDMIYINKVCVYFLNFNFYTFNKVLFFIDSLPELSYNRHFHRLAANRYL